MGEKCGKKRMLFMYGVSGSVSRRVAIVKDSCEPQFSSFIS